MFYFCEFFQRCSGIWDLDGSVVSSSDSDITRINADFIVNEQRLRNMSNFPRIQSPSSSFIEEKSCLKIHTSASLLNSIDQDIIRPEQLNKYP